MLKHIVLPHFEAAFFAALHYPKTHQKCYTDFIETFSNNPNKKVGMTIEKINIGNSGLLASEISLGIAHER